MEGNKQPVALGREHGADQRGGNETTPGMRLNAVLPMTDPVNSAGSASARLGQQSQRMA